MMGPVTKPKVFVVVGTRPEAVKMAPVLRALRALRGLDPRLVAAAQHRALLDGALNDFGLTPDFDLNLMRPDQDHEELRERAVDSVGALIRRERPAFVLVQGDTTTALAAALAAAEAGVPVGHVEAGLRTGDFSQPFPEEANRVLIDAISAFRFATTSIAAANLRREGAAAKSVVLTGNTAVDAARWIARRRRPVRDAALARVLRAARGKKLILATMHRRESIDGGISGACRGLAALLDAVPDALAILPVHLNPRVSEKVRAALSHPRARLLAPLNSFDMARALDACRLVVTDSGGLQEEAALRGKPALILRRVTDRPETVKAGLAFLVGGDAAAIVRRGKALLRRRPAKRSADLYGDGRAAARIARAVALRLGV